MTNTAFETQHPREPVGRFVVKAQGAPQVTLSSKAVSGHVNEFVMGSPDSLNAQQRLAVVRIFGEMPVRPDVVVHDEDAVELIYNVPETTLRDPETVRLTLDSDGKIASAGSGEWWEDDDQDQKDLVRLRGLGL
ncbi:MAG: hypothetical protein JWM84_3196 [Nocardioides sp.]|jgi:hypothetical protein|nr:hypothetical protein [Nocardioides sp.]